MLRQVTENPASHANPHGETRTGEPLSSSIGSNMAGGRVVEESCSLIVCKMKVRSKLTPHHRLNQVTRAHQNIADIKTDDCIPDHNSGACASKARPAEGSKKPFVPQQMLEL